MVANQRKYTAPFKAIVVLEVLHGKNSPADACRTDKLHYPGLTRWKHEFLECSHQAFEVSQQVTQAAGKVAELECMVGQLTMQLKIA